MTNPTGSGKRTTDDRKTEWASVVVLAKKDGYEVHNRSVDEDEGEKRGVDVGTETAGATNPSREECMIQGIQKGSPYGKPFREGRSC